MQQREIKPEEMQVVFRLALRYPDLADLEKDLDRLDAMQARLQELSRPRVMEGAKDPGTQSVRPSSVDDLLKLREAGVISDATVRWFLGVQEPRQAPAPPLPAPKDLWQRHLPERLAWAVLWRIGLLPSVVAFQEVSTPIAIAGIAVAAVALIAAALVGGYAKRLTLLGAVWREAAALLLLYAILRLSPSLGVLLALGTALVLGLATDALLSTLAEEDG